MTSSSGTLEAPLAGVLATFDELFASLSTVRDAAALILAEDPEVFRSPRPEDLARVRPLVGELLIEHGGLITGAGVVLAPGTAGAPRWIEWWWADREGLPKRLEVELDPDSSEFYDYTTVEWYREPERTGERFIAGPYVDYICTREYTFTCSMPLVVDGRFVGVAGADILAARIERSLGSALAGLDHRAVLVNAHGRVVASNTSDYPPGSLPRLGRGHQLTTNWSLTTPTSPLWRLVKTPPIR